MKLNFNQQRMAIIIFARLNSRRLPKKVMSKVGSKPLLLFIIDRIKKNSNFRLPIIVATSKNKSNNEIEIFCKKNKIKVFRGELDDVFKFNEVSLQKVTDLLKGLPRGKGCGPDDISAEFIHD